MRWLVHYDADEARWYVCLTGEGAPGGHEERFDAATWAEACGWLRRITRAETQVQRMLLKIRALS